MLRFSFPAAGRYVATCTVVASMLVVLVSCSDNGNDDCNDPRDIAGTWTGTRDDDAPGEGTLSITFAQAGCSLSGSWSSSFPGDLLPTTGSVGGTTDEREVAVSLTPSAPGGCTLRLTGTLVIEDRISGGYRNVDCAADGGGTFSVVRGAVPSPTPGT